MLQEKNKIARWAPVQGIPPPGKYRFALRHEAQWMRSQALKMSEQMTCAPRSSRFGLLAETSLGYKRAKRPSGADAESLSFAVGRHHSVVENTSVFTHVRQPSPRSTLLIFRTSSETPHQNHSQSMAASPIVVAWLLARRLQSRR